LPAQRPTDAVTRDEVETFLARIPDADSLSGSALIDYFVFFLTVIRGAATIGPSSVERCFDVVHLHPPVARVYMARHAERGRGKRPKFVRDAAGYKLERSRRSEIEQQLLPVGPGRVETSQTLRELLPQVRIETERNFLQEAIDCYEVGAYRAAIVMGWLLALDHLFEFVLRHKLAEFNLALAKNTDKRVRVTAVRAKDDFSEMPESKFIEFCRSAGIINNDVRKVLDTKLGIRNSVAHPSAIAVSQVRATEFLDDLVQNVVLRFSI
jgi:hypothetical protein